MLAIAVLLPAHRTISHDIKGNDKIYRNVCHKAMVATAFKQPLMECRNREI